MNAPAPEPLLPPRFPFDWASDWGEDGYGPWVAFTYKGVRQCLRWIPPGRFLMGSPQDAPERWGDELQHPVTLTHGLWLADTACTQALWKAVMGENPSHFEGAEHPVEQVSWDEVQAFIDRLNGAIPSLDLRLPTEAEWEYACRAGTQTPFWFGEKITPAQVNYDGNYSYAGGTKGLYRNKTVAVTDLPCNAWGLYQMHGNVWEWCEDWYGEYPTDAFEDPTGPATGERRVLRGGGWNNIGGYARSAQRPRFTPDFRRCPPGKCEARGG